MDDECCVVCAEPLEWTGYGPCCHIQACSKCVARLRFVLKDKRCVICQQESDTVFFTRYAGAFTKILPADQFRSLKGGGEHRHLSIIGGYFDDENQFNTIKSLCSYTHPDVEAVTDVKFGSLRLLKEYIKDHLDKQFCHICLQGRKVFVCEQLLYTPQELKRHKNNGDLIGPLAEGGFKGHPMCEFCRNRFFSESELFKHNSERHETCFLCRRENPGVYRYYRNLQELEVHFEKTHFPCPHPDCREAHFVVFKTKEELDIHFSTSHEQGNKRRPAIPLNFQYPQPSVRGRGRFQIGARQEYAPSTMPTAFPPETEENAVSDIGPIQLTPDDFPSFIDAPLPPATATWPVKGNRGGSRLRDNDFPSLPGQTALPARSLTAPKAPRTMATRLAKPGRNQANAPSKTMPNPNLQVMRRPGSSPQLSANRTPSPPNWPGRNPRSKNEPKTDLSWVTLSKTNDRENAFPTLSTVADVSRPIWNRTKYIPKTEPQPARPKGVSISDSAAFPSLPGGGHSQRPASKKAPIEAKVSEGLRDANKALTKKLKDQMDSETFKQFQKSIEDFHGGLAVAEVFHNQLVNHGLAHYISQIASLCPNAAKREEVLSVHREFIEQCKKDPHTAPVFVPLSVLERSFEEAMSNSIWTCQKCQTLNLPQSDFCEACDTKQTTPFSSSLPVPSPYRRSNRTLFGVDDRHPNSRSKNVWNKLASQSVESLRKARNLVRYFDHLSPYDQAAFNSALLIWNSISEVPQDKRIKLLDSLNQFDIKRLWKISADRYNDNKDTSLEMTTYSALNDLPTKPGEVVQFEGRVATRTKVFGFGKFRKMFFIDPESYGIHGRTILSGVPFGSRFYPLYFEALPRQSRIPTTGEVSDLRLEFLSEEQSLELVPPGNSWPKGRDPIYPYHGGVTEYLRPIGPGCYVGVSWREPRLDINDLGRYFQTFLLVKSVAQ